MTDSKNKPGRPSKLEFSMLSAVGPLVADGLSYEAIAAELGVSRRVLFDWITRGEAPDAPQDDDLFVQFALAVRKAEAALERKLLADMRGAEGKKGEFNRFAWVLERRFPGRWGSKHKLEHSGEVAVNGIAELLALAFDNESEPKPT